MSDRVKVGTNKLTFTVSAFDYPREDFATAVVDVPVYAKSDNVLTDQRSMSVEAVMPEDFNEKVKHALQVFADTLEASFKEESTNVQQKSIGKSDTSNAHTAAKAQSSRKGAASQTRTSSSCITSAQKII